MQSLQFASHFFKTLFLVIQLTYLPKFDHQCLSSFILHIVSSC